MAGGYGHGKPAAPAVPVIKQPGSCQIESFSAVALCFCRGGLTPLNCAAAAGCLDVVVLLLTQGAQLDRADYVSTCADAGLGMACKATMRRAGNVPYMMRTTEQ